MRAGADSRRGLHLQLDPARRVDLRVRLTALASARDTLLAELREHALVIGDVTLSSGQRASYYVDARRALLRPAGFRAAGELIAEAAHELGAQAVGGPATAAIPPACAALAAPGADGLVGFFVRGERKEHGLQRWVEGPVEAGARCLVVEDTVTTGGSTVRAIERMREEGLEIVGAVCVVDRLAGGGEAIAEAAGAPFRALVTIDELYPERPDRA
jgi:orotate phosphoribosyltransferase